MRERERGGGSRVINLFDDDDRLVDGGGEKILEKFVVFVFPACPKQKQQQQSKSNDSILTSDIQQKKTKRNPSLVFP